MFNVLLSLFLKVFSKKISLLGKDPRKGLDKTVLKYLEWFLRNLKEQEICQKRFSQSRLNLPGNAGPFR